MERILREEEKEEEELLSLEERPTLLHNCDGGAMLLQCRLVNRTTQYPVSTPVLDPAATTFLR